MSNRSSPGGWQEERNPWGGVRRFRMVAGGVKEYEGTVTIDGIDVPESEVDAFHQRRAAERAQRIATARQRAAQRPPTVCPFKMQSVNGACERTCAFYDDGCILAVAAARPTKDTQGAYCPVAGKCQKVCTMYDGGCKLTQLVKGLMPGKE